MAILFILVLAMPHATANDPLGPQNDADSGGDVGDTPGEAHPIGSTAVLRGHLDPTEGDTSDYYTFEAEAGSVMHYAFRGDGFVCMRVLDATFNVVDWSCNTLPHITRRNAVEIETTGSYLLRFVVDNNNLPPLLGSPSVPAWYSLSMQLDSIPQDPPHPVHDLPEPLSQDDAGYGGDAPNCCVSPFRAFPVMSDTSYTAHHLTSHFDTTDEYVFEARAGDTVQVAFRGILVFLEIQPVDGAPLTPSDWSYALQTTVTPVITIPSDGQYTLRFETDAWVAVNPYSFNLGINNVPSEPPLPPFVNDND